MNNWRDVWKKDLINYTRFLVNCYLFFYIENNNLIWDVYVELFWVFFYVFLFFVLFRLNVLLRRLIKFKLFIIIDINIKIIINISLFILVDK